MGYIHDAIQVFDSEKFWTCITFISGARHRLVQLKINNAFAWVLRLQSFYLQRDCRRGLHMYTTAFIFSSFPSTTLAVYTIVSQVWLLVLKLHISKLSYIYLIFLLIYCFDLYFVLFIIIFVNLKKKTKGKEICTSNKNHICKRV